MYKKWIFSGFVVKKLPSRTLPGSAVYCQRSWVAEKHVMIHSSRSLFFYVDGNFSCNVYFDTDILLGRNSSVSPTNNDKPIYAVKTDFVSQVYIIRSTIHDKNNNTVGAKISSLWGWIFTPFLLPTRFAVNRRTRGNATRQFWEQTH